MQWLACLAVIAVVIGVVSVFRDVWAQYRVGKRSLATALAITCIVAGMPTVFVAVILERAESEVLRAAVQAVGIGLVIAGGVFGAVGLILDRRPSKPGDEQRDDPAPDGLRSYEAHLPPRR